MADAFRTQVLQNKEASATPVVTLGSCSFLYTREVCALIQRSSRRSCQALADARSTRLPSAARTAEQRLCAGADARQHKCGGSVPFHAAGSPSLLAASPTRASCKPLTRACAWRQVITLFKSYFNTFDEDSLRNNFVLIYELLDGASPYPLRDNRAEPRV